MRGIPNPGGVRDVVLSGSQQIRVGDIKRPRMFLRRLLGVQRCDGMATGEVCGHGALAWCRVFPKGVRSGSWEGGVLCVSCLPAAC